MSEQSALRIIALGSLWGLISRAGHVCLSLATTAILARLLTPEDFGIIAITAIFLILTNAVLEGIIEYTLLRISSPSREIIGALTWLGISFSASTSILLTLNTNYLQTIFQIPNLDIALTATIPIFFFQPLTVAGKALLRKELQFRIISLITLATSSTYLLATTVLAIAGFGFWSLVIGQLFSQLVSATSYAVASKLRPTSPSIAALYGIRKALTLNTLSRIAAWAWTSVDTAAVGIAQDAASVGVYSRSYNLTTQAKEIQTAIDHPLRQALFQLHDDRPSFAKKFKLIFYGITAANTALAATIITLRHQIVSIILGATWTSVGDVLAILIAGLPARAALNLIDSCSIITGHEYRVTARHLTLLLLISLGLFSGAASSLALTSLTITLSLYAALFFMPNVCELKKVEIFTLTAIPVGTAATICGAGEIVVSHLSLSNFFDLLARLLTISLCLLAIFLTIPSELRRQFFFAISGIRRLVKPAL